MHAAAVEGRLALQHCADCGAVHYPPREVCATCLSDRLDWEVTADGPGEVLAQTTLHHSNEARVGALLPLRLGLVRLLAGPVAVCFLGNGTQAGDRVRVRAELDPEGRVVLRAEVE